jgi:hypothetical protein
MVNIIASSVGCRARSLIFIVRASALGAGNATKHRNKAHQPASGKCDRCNGHSPGVMAIDSPAGMT